MKNVDSLLEGNRVQWNQMASSPSDTCMWGWQVISKDNVICFACSDLLCLCSFPHLHLHPTSVTVSSTHVFRNAVLTSAGSRAVSGLFLGCHGLWPPCCRRDHCSSLLLPLRELLSHISLGLEFKGASDTFTVAWKKFTQGYLFHLLRLNKGLEYNKFTATSLMHAKSVHPYNIIYFYKLIPNLQYYTVYMYMTVCFGSVLLCGTMLYFLLFWYTVIT